METVWLIVIIMTGGYQHLSVSITTLPHEFATRSDCVRFGSDLVFGGLKHHNINYTCIETPKVKKDE